MKVTFDLYHISSDGRYGTWYDTWSSESDTLTSSVMDEQLEERIARWGTSLSSGEWVLTAASPGNVMNQISVYYVDKTGFRCLRGPFVGAPRNISRWPPK